MSLADKIKQQEEEAKKAGIANQQGGDWFKLKEGDNVFRVLTEPELFFEKYKVGICYTDCGYQGTPKFMAFVQDVADGKIKLAKLPYSVGEAIAEFEKDEDYAFEGYPMPYNIKVKAKGAGTKEVKYQVVASPKRGEVEPWVLEELSKKTAIPQIIEKMKENQKKKHMEDGTWQAEQERKAKLKADLAEAMEHGAEPVVEYPADDINIDDIPF